MYVPIFLLPPSTLSHTPPRPLSSQLFLSHSPRYSTGLTDSPFESKAIALIQAIHDKEVSWNPKSLLFMCKVMLTKEWMCWYHSDVH